MRDGMATIVSKSPDGDAALEQDVYEKPTIAPRSTRFAYYLSAVAAIGGFLFGYDTGVVSATMLWIPKKINLTYSQESWLVSITLLFCALFSLVAGTVNDHFGRRRAILAASAAFVIGSVVLSASFSLGMLLVGRAIVGMAIGVASMTVPPYLAECSPYHVRGLMTIGFQFMIVFGQFIASVVGGTLSMSWADPGNAGWRAMLGIASVPALLQFLAMLFMPESPRWLVEHGRDDEARKVLSRMYTSIAWQKFELYEMQQQHREVQRAHDERVAEQRKRSNAAVMSNTLFLMLTTAHVRRALILGCMLQLFQQLAGINTLMYFTATIIKMSGVRSPESAIWLSCAATAVNCFFTFVPMYLIERAGRRKLWIGTVVCALTFLGVGFLVIHNTAPKVGEHISAQILGNLTGNERSTAIACAAKSTCDDCVTVEWCGFCFKNSHNATAESHSNTYGYCLPVDLNSDKQTSWAGACDNTSVIEDYTWQYGYCDSPYSWLVLVGMLLYLMCFTIGMGPVPWVLNAEIYPNWARSTGAALSTATNWTANFVISETFLLLTEVVHKYGAFFIYAVITLLSLLYFYFELPETRGVPTEEVEDLFKHKRRRQFTSE